MVLSTVISIISFFVEFMVVMKRRAWREVVKSVESKDCRGTVCVCACPIRVRRWRFCVNHCVLFMYMFPCDLHLYVVFVVGFKKTKHIVLIEAKCQNSLGMIWLVMQVIPCKDAPGLFWSQPKVTIWKDKIKIHVIGTDIIHRAGQELQYFCCSHMQVRHSTIVVQH